MISAEVRSTKLDLQVSVHSGPRNQISPNDNDVLPPLSLEGGISYSKHRLKTRVARTLTNHHGSPIIKVNQGKTGDMTAAFTVRVSDETASKLNQIAEKLDRSRAYMAAE